MHQSPLGTTRLVRNVEVTQDKDGQRIRRGNEKAPLSHSFRGESARCGRRQHAIPTIISRLHADIAPHASGIEAKGTFRKSQAPALRCSGPAPLFKKQLGPLENSGPVANRIHRRPRISCPHLRLVAYSFACEPPDNFVLHIERLATVGSEAHGPKVMAVFISINTDVHPKPVLPLRCTAPSST